MKKILTILVLSSIVFSACTQDSPENAGANITIDKISFKNNSLTANSSKDSASTLEFYIYLERPDLGVSQPKNDKGIYTSDLPLFLQPKSISANENACDKVRFPHKCTLNLTESDYEKSLVSPTIKITFGDDFYIEKKIEIHFPKALEAPEILEPTSIPTQHEQLRIKFADVGADIYEVSVNLCFPYQNDGINPCLDGITYTLARELDGIVYKFGDEFTNPSVSLVDGFVEVDSEFPLIFDDSIEYFVKAIRSEQTENGIDSYSEITSSKVFEI